MIDIPILIQQIGVLLLLILPGMALKWMRLAPEGLAVGLSNLILYIAQPVLFVAGFVAVDPTPAIVIRMLAVLVAAMVVHPLFFFVAKQRQAEGVGLRYHLFQRRLYRNPPDAGSV